MIDILIYSGILFWAVILVSAVVAAFAFHSIKNDDAEYYESESDLYFKKFKGK